MPRQIAGAFEIIIGAYQLPEVLLQPKLCPDKNMKADQLIKTVFRLTGGYGSLPGISWFQDPFHTS